MYPFQPYGEAEIAPPERTLPSRVKTIRSIPRKKAAPAAPPCCKKQPSLIACPESKLCQNLQPAKFDDPKIYKLWTSKIANFK